MWLTLVAVTDVIGSQLVAGTGEYTEEEQDRDVRIVLAIENDMAFRDRDCVSLAEAGLIRYFRPPYNDRLNNNFPGSAAGAPRIGPQFRLS